MHPFDWGIFKPWGELILVVTATIYCCTIWISGRIWWRLSRRAKRWYIPALPGVLILGVMICRAGNFLLWQTTSGHYQETIHMTAVITVGVGLLASGAAGLMAGVRH